jgi:hypothetical protein
MKSRFCSACLISIIAGISQISVADLLSASTAFLDSLTPDQKAGTMRPFDSDQRANWHFIPKKRMGLSFKTLSDAQDKLLLNILSEGLSREGYAKVETIRSLEAVLRKMEGAEHRDIERYHILFFGEPTTDGNWTLRYEGHHVSLHWTFVAGKLVSSSPRFLGSNPAEVRIEGPQKGLRVLKDEEDLARKLLNSLSQSQQEAAIIARKVPTDIFTANHQKAERLDHTGISYTALNKKQMKNLMAIIETCANIQPQPIAQQRLAEIHEAGLEEIKFAWIGSPKKGRPHYYRVQGPTFLIEYDCIQNQANHIHVVWRDFEGDFGRDILQQHHARFFDPEHPNLHQH